MASTSGKRWQLLADAIRVARQLFRLKEGGYGTWVPERPRRSTKGKCVCCGSTENIESDHVIPKAGGGHQDSPRNRQPLCRTCNRSKGTSDRCRVHNRYLGPPGGDKGRERR